MILDSIIPHILFGVPNRRSFHIYRYWQSRLFDLLQTIYFSFTRVCVKKKCRASILWPRAIPSHANPRILRIASLWGHVWGHYLRSWVKNGLLTLYVTGFIMTLYSRVDWSGRGAWTNWKSCSSITRPECARERTLPASSRFCSFYRYWCWMVVLHSDSGCPPTLTSEGLDRQLTVQMKRKISLELGLEKNNSPSKKSVLDEHPSIWSAVR